MKYHLHYIDPFSILLVDNDGKLQRLKCPFRVKCTQPIQNLYRGDVVWVSMVKSDGLDKLSYVIQSEVFPYHHFVILKEENG